MPSPALTHFQPTFYLSLALGLTGFCIAVEAPGLWVFTIAALLLHSWLVRTGRFHPIPRLIANVITLLALAYTFHAIRNVPSPIIAIGQFLVLLQGVKLFEMRANRDQAQLIVLSLLLMVAGAITTASLAFGLLMLVYLFVTLYCCLLFHLKTEHEQAIAAQTLPPEKLNAATVRQDQRFLARSMKKLTGLVAAMAILMAIAVFLFFPRGTGAGMFGQLQLRPGQALTGFSDHVSFGQIGSISQNTEIVANVQVWHNGQPVEGTQALYLRGKTLEVYNAADRRWEHLPSPVIPHDLTPNAGSTVELLQQGMRPAGDEYRQRISLRPTGSSTLFAMAYPVSFRPDRDGCRVRYNYDDQTIEVASPIYHRFDYEVVSRRPTVRTAAIDRMIDFEDISPRLTEYARRPQVSGVDEQGQSLASQRLRNLAVTDLDERIAANIETHLRTQFEYTLDLPSVATIDPRKDPVEQFVFEWKKGHCEYFASAMTLMLQSLGIRARMVTGFKCDEYDPSMGHYYIVRQSHAHAWVEVRTTSGWKQFDPTSSTLAASSRQRTTWQAIRHFFAFLDYKWASNVIAYDAERRENLISAIERRAGETAARNTTRLGGLWRGITGWLDAAAGKVRQWLHSGQGQIVSAHLLMALVLLSASVIGYWVLSNIARRWRMRQRAQRIGLDQLPPAERMRLARQLGFYERLMRLLARHRIVRPDHLTPAEFGKSLIFLPSQVYDTIRDLTEVFYAVRFGRKELPAAEQRELESRVDGLGAVLGNSVSIR